VAMSSAPGFLTNHELDRFLGGGAAGQRQRLRLLKDGLLPAPEDLGRVQRFNIDLFPRFALAGCVRDLAGIDGAIAAMNDANLKLRQAAAFKEMTAAVCESARLLAAWDFDELIRGAVERAGEAMVEYDRLVVHAERDLQERLGIAFRTDFGVIAAATQAFVDVTLHSGEMARVPLARCAVAAHEHAEVALERVSVLAKELGYVMPVEHSAEQDEELAAWFSAVSAPMRVPNLVMSADAIRSEPDSVEGFPYRRPRPRSGRWHGASTMTRTGIST